LPIGKHLFHVIPPDTEAFVLTIVRRLAGGDNRPNSARPSLLGHDIHWRGTIQPFRTGGGRPDIPDATAALPKPVATLPAKGQNFARQPIFVPTTIRVRSRSA
jgi:hypothetical protein